MGDVCRSMQLDGLGSLRFGNAEKKDCKIKICKKRDDDLYNRLRVVDISNDCCQWLVCDVQRLQNEAKNNEKNECHAKQISMCNEDESNENIASIVSHSSSILHNVYNENDQIIEISHVDMSRAEIEKNEGQKIDFAEAIKSNIRNTDDETLEFVNLCDFMQHNFDPANDGEVRRD